MPGTRRAVVLLFLVASLCAITTAAPLATVTHATHSASISGQGILRRAKSYSPTSLATATVAQTVTTTTDAASFILASNASTNATLDLKNMALVVNSGSAYSVLYYGGPVIAKVEVNPIFLGKAVLNQSSITAFYKFLVKSSHMDILTKEYSTNSTKIGYGSVKSTRLETNKTYTNRQQFDDTDVQAYLLSLLKANAIKPNKNSYYPIYFPPGVVLTQKGVQSCVSFCAFHGTMDISVQTKGKVLYLYYAVFPDQTGKCNGGCGNGTPFENLCSVSSHELTEAITDPAVSLASRVEAPLAWYDATSGEIADICNAQQANMTDKNGKKWVVQKIWSNSLKQCIAQYPSV
ncbi:hypothetical protein BC830DRAFT_189588 [Chytriomyces sp. MP71]|nr:hypothetical protein BC830DRAFT_189588 [Chytriomyces sp. MP71]